MKHVLLAFVFVGSVGSALAQPCTPNPLYVDSVYSVWPDTTTNFVSGVVGTPYFQDLNLIVPQDAGLANPNFAGFTIDSISIGGVTGLPPGLSYQCASQTSASCSYITGQLGCAVITGTPTTAGNYPITINVTAYVNLAGSALPVPQDFGGYRIIITDTGTGVMEASLVGLAAVRNIPNPFTTRTSIEFQLARAGEVKLRVFNLLGDELWSQVVAARTGMNKVAFDGNDLQDGIYLYKIESGRDAFTGRMVLHH